MMLISGQNLAGTGSAQAFYRSEKSFIQVAVSGNSASASLWNSPDGASGWMLVTAFVMASNTTATAQLTGFYPYMQGQVDWASGGTRTAMVYMWVVGNFGGG